MPYAGSSYFSRTTADSSLEYAVAAAHSSYMYYNNITWSFWGAFMPSINKNIFSQFQETGNLRSWIFSTQSNGTFRTIFSWDGTNISLHTTSGVVLTGAWAHYAVTYLNGVQKVYINAAQRTLNETIALSGTTLFACNRQVMVGSKNPNSPPIDEGVDGCFTTFAMFNSAFNQAQITELYNNGTTMDLNSHSCAAHLTNWWGFDHTDSDTTITDKKQGSSQMTITKSGANAFFNKSASVPNYNSDTGVLNVLQGVSYVFQGSSQVGARSLMNTSNIAAAVWDAQIVNHSSASTFGQFIQQKLLTTIKFLGLK